MAWLEPIITLGSLVYKKRKSVPDFLKRYSSADKLNDGIVEGEKMISIN
jgi:hypothetical protein